MRQLYVLQWTLILLSSFLVPGYFANKVINTGIVEVNLNAKREDGTWTAFGRNGTGISKILRLNKNYSKMKH
jgi:hypothetical protein